MQNTTPVDVLTCQNCVDGYTDQDDECPSCDGYGFYDYKAVARMSELIDIFRAQLAYYGVLTPTKRAEPAHPAHPMDLDIDIDVEEAA
jgi:hypothetical protein